MARISGQSKVDVTLLRRMVKVFPEMTLQDLGDYFGVSKERISQLVRQHSLPYKKKAGNRLKHIDIRDLQKTISANPTWTLLDLAVHYGVSDGHISNLIRDHKLDYIRKVGPNLSIDLDALQQAIDDNPNWRMKDLALHFNVAQMTISRTIRLYKLRYQHKVGMDKKLYADNVQEVIEANPSWTLEQVGSHFGTSGVAISRFIKKHGLKYVKKKKT